LRLRRAIPPPLPRGVASSTLRLRPPPSVPAPPLLSRLCLLTKLFVSLSFFRLCGGFFLLCGAKTTKHGRLFPRGALTGLSGSPGPRGPDPGPGVESPFYSFLFVFYHVGGLPVGRSRLSPWWPSLASQVSPGFKISTPLRVLCVPFFLNTFSTALLVGQM